MALKIGFIGAGKMAEAMIEGILAKDLFSSEEIGACAPSISTRERMASEHGIAVFETAAELAEKTDFLVLAVKPAQVEGVFREKGLEIGPEHLVMSIVAGLSTEVLESYVPGGRIVRVMPNHCCMVLEGASGYSPGKNATEADLDRVESVLEAVGSAFEVRESDMDAVTGVSGSGPAYVYMMIDAMADGGVLCGLPREVAIELAAQTVLGAAKTVLETGQHPDVLKDSVCSPGGTTIEGVRALEDRAIRSAFIDAVRASAERSRRMGKGN
ncbi:MAG: pyrroline-5-carboxylate reductase [Candidatus Methanomethylophilaceae archaeon]|jgi:pyrroline-5-carboxylate reductase|nr:pyrroline-5-carboxylate reductase [Candidatus Methanomethylophilaceae archaeon]NLF33599.1 pyrroline-5-carboxylate reductase [Thermoplasmatales archaeon]